MTKEQEYQAFSNYLGMSPKAYVARGLALKRAVEGSHSFEGTEVGVGGLAPRGSVTSLTSLPTTKSKRILRLMRPEGRNAVERLASSPAGLVGETRPSNIISGRNRMAERESGRSPAHFSDSEKPKRVYSVIVRRGKYFNWKTKKFETKNLAHWKDYAR